MATLAAVTPGGPGLADTVVGGDAGTVPRPALFQVGAAVRGINVNPQVPLYSGGYSYSPPITRQYTPLQVRAFYVSNGRHAAEFAVVDSQAYFAAYQAGPRLGITADRAAAAREITRERLGPAMRPADIIVQGSHSHSAPTLEGIWGPTPVSYLRRVHRQTVAALVAAARAARPAYLQFGEVNAPQIADTAIADDTLPGWDSDGQISVLRAVSPVSRATIAQFVSVPAHPVTIDGAAKRMLGDDYFAPLRRLLDRRLGGTAVVGPATLGRQEPPVQTTNRRQLGLYAHTLYGLVCQALARARWVRDPTVAAAQQLLTVPAENAALLALVAANHAPPAVRSAIAAATGIYPINRADTPPYQSGNVIGTYLTAIRVGRVLFLSQPGEPYPEIRWTLRRDIPDAAAVVALSKGQDDLGYYMPAWTYPFSVAAQTDHPIFNIAPQMGDQVVIADASLAREVGLRAGPLPASLPAPRNFAQAVNPGLQALADDYAGDVRHGRYRPRLEAIYNPALYDGHPAAGPVHWSFGDGTHARTGYLRTATGIRGGVGIFRHPFRPGRHRVRLWVRDSAGTVARWRLTVQAYPALHPRVHAFRAGLRCRLTAQASGGDGTVIAARWRLPTGQVRHGLHLVTLARQVKGTRLTVVDGTGTRATRRLGRASDGC